MNCKRLLVEGINLYNSLVFQRAYEKFNKVLSICPDNKRALIWRGKAELMLGQLDKAVKDLRKGSDADSLLHLALALYLYSFFLIEREKVLKRAFYTAASAERGFKIMGKKHYRNLFPYYRFFSKLSAHIEVLSLAESYRLGYAEKVLNEIENRKEVRDEYGRVIDKLSDPPTVSTYIADAYMGLLNYLVFRAFSRGQEYSLYTIDNAMHELEIESDMENLGFPIVIFLKDFIHLFKGRILLEGLGRPEDALAEFDEVSGTGAVRLVALFYKGRVYETKGQLNEACEAYSEILKTLGYAPRVLLRVKALNCNSTPRPPEDQCNSLLNNGIKLYNSMKFLEALDTFSSALKLCPNDNRALLWKGKAELMLGKFDQAISTLESSRSTAIDSDLFLALALYIYSLFTPDKLQKAISYAEEGSKRVNDQFSVELFALLKFLSLYEAGKRNEAERVVKGLEATGQRLFKSLQRVEQAYLDMGQSNFDSAISNINGALNALKSDLVRQKLELPLLVFLKDFIHVSKARILLEAYGYKEALIELNKVSNTNPVRLLSLLYKARLYEMTGEKVKACMSYSEILKVLESPSIREKFRECGRFRREST